ncbi:hypothetical protein SELMODRAFT_270565 [Selaginella moellendorffii]|uniref:EF-hand domain-containing protein n=1 Tax=Selaginella moellendorffii TaxID=88036 RepID=D8R5Z2_SELML|nr:uncharacterized mitochondrial carrier YPR011C [Selaginella moellendorffii]EFJ32235.1 hypothetical protein SELMODRAFT_270565 [Selaginella moellendorffii]|eukprot:XP_024527140.1 uncharacterized mitochondrial carrier YPR011C [Selaginella moellendorffii]
MASLDHREARRAQVRWARIEGLSPVLPIPRDNLGLGGAGLGFASISLFGRRKPENAGREEAAPAQAVPYSPKRGTYAHDALQRRFKELDKQNAGHISENDLKAVLKSLNLPSSEENVQEFLDSLGGNTVPFDQFAEYAVSRENLLFDTFRELDKNNTGYLTTNEIKAALVKYKFRFSDSDLQALARTYSKVGAGPFDENQLFDFADYRNCLMAYSQKDLIDADQVWARAAIDVGDVDTSFPLISAKKGKAGDLLLSKDKILKHLSLGVLASAVTRTLVAPLERVKLLSTVDSNIAFGKAFEEIRKDEGFQGLFRGNLLNVARVIPTRVVEFLVYDKLKETLLSKRKQSEISNFDRLLLGTFASMAGVIAGYPLDTMRTVLASQLPNRHVDDLMVKSALDNGGFLNLYRGLIPNLARAVPYTLITFTVFNHLQERHRQKTGPGGEIKTSVDALFGIVAATAAQTLVHPLEVVQRRLQAETAKQGVLVYNNMINAFQVILEKEGVNGLYSGLAASYVKIVPATAISLLLYKALKEKLDDRQRR